MVTESSNGRVHLSSRHNLRSVNKRLRKTPEELDEEPEIVHKRPRLPNNGRDTFQQLAYTFNVLCHSNADEDKLDYSSRGISSKKFHAARKRAEQANDSAEEAIHKCSRQTERALALHEASVHVMEDQYFIEMFNGKDW
jgi:hypothetical protein